MAQINNIEQKFSSEIDNFNKEIKEIKMNNEYLNKQIILITNQISKLNEKIENDINNKNDIIKKGNKYKFEKLLQRIELLEEDKNDINNENIVIDKEDINEGINVLKKIIKRKKRKYGKIKKLFYK